jgi:sulfate/thiosulfate transport system permease protein
MELASGRIIHRRTLKQHVLPGFSVTLGFTILYLSLIVLLPVSTLFFKTFNLSWEEFYRTITSARVLAAFRLSFGTAFAAAIVNLIFGLLLAWSLVRYEFRGKRIVDAFVDLPFALPTAIAGITLTTLYSEQGWFGQILHRVGIDVVYTPLGITVALIFIGLPFVVRTVQPIIESLDKDVEEAAVSLGAGRYYILTRVILPALWPAAVTGFALAFARTLGEYGSVVFIAGNMPMKTEITTLLIVTRLEQYDYPGATALAIAMLSASFALLLFINVLQSRVSRKGSSR